MSSVWLAATAPGRVSLLIFQLYYRDPLNNIALLMSYFVLYHNNNINSWKVALGRVKDNVIDSSETMISPKKLLIPSTVMSMKIVVFRYGITVFKLLRSLSKFSWSWSFCTRLLLLLSCSGCDNSKAGLRGERNFASILSFFLQMMWHRFRQWSLCYRFSAPILCAMFHFYG